MRERVRAGIKNAKANGKEWGRPRRVLDRRRAIDLRQQGMSYPQIAREWGVADHEHLQRVRALSYSFRIGLPYSSRQVSVCRLVSFIGRCVGEQLSARSQSREAHAWKWLNWNPWLGGRDSNPDTQIQSLQSYR